MSKNGFISAACDDFNDLQFISRIELAFEKLRWSDSVAIVFDDDAARQKVLREQKFFNGTRKRRGDGLSVGNDDVWFHEEVFLIREGHSFLSQASAASQSFQTGS